MKVVIKNNVLRSLSPRNIAKTKKLSASSIFSNQSLKMKRMKRISKKRQKKCPPRSIKASSPVVIHLPVRAKPRRTRRRKVSLKSLTLTLLCS